MSASGTYRTSESLTSLARPGGNITGVSVEAGTDIWGKRLQVLRETVPTASKVGYLGSRQMWDLPQVNALREAARPLGISLQAHPSKARSKAKSIGAFWEQ